MNLEKRKYGEKESDFDYYLDVTKYVKPLFGNILSKAEFVIDGYNTEQEAKEQAREAIKYFQKIENSIDVDAECLLLYLKNGIKIEFSTSEWGCIRFPSSNKKDFSGDKLENLSDDKIRNIYNILSDYCESDVEITDNEILTMAYLKYPNNINNAISLFRKDVEKEIINRFMYLQ